MTTVLEYNVGGVDYTSKYASDSLGVAMDAESVYPVDVGPTVLGEIWAPKLFAQGLDGLELGADGKVAFVADGARAMEVGVSDGVTDLTFAGDSFAVSTGTKDILTASPLAGGGTAATLAASSLDVVATGGTALTGDTVTVQAAAALDVTGETMNLTATSGDVVFTSDGNPTLTVKQGRVVISGDVEIEGVISTAGVSNMSLTDDFIELADGQQYETAVGLPMGLAVNTVPDALAFASYLEQFTGADGAAAFFTDGALDPAKYAAANEVLWKGVLFNSNKGSHVAGLRTTPSRLDEPYWDFTGGALQLSRAVPDPDAGVVMKVSMSMRVTDSGEFEVVQQRRQIDFVDGEYVDGPVTDAQVVARFGHSKANAPIMVLRVDPAHVLGAEVEDTVAVSAYPLTTVLTFGQLTQGLYLDGNVLKGTVSTVAPADYTLAAVATMDGDEVETIRQFQQRTGITGVGGGFGRPSNVIVTEVGTAFGGKVARNLLINSGPAGEWWHSDSASVTGSAEFTVTFPTPTPLTHVRMWRHGHSAGNYLQKVLIYGDGALVAEYGREVRPPISNFTDTSSSQAPWSASFTELYIGSTVAIAVPGSYTVYRFYFPDLAADGGAAQNYLSLGRVQLLNVAAGAAAPPDLFLPPATFAAVPMFPSVDATFSYQLPTAAGTTYALARGAALPSWLTLSPEGLLSGQATAEDTTASVAIRALTSAAATNSHASATSVLDLKTVAAIVTARPSQLAGYADGDAIATFGDFVQPVAAAQPTYVEPIASARFLGGGQSLGIRDGVDLDMRLASAGGFSIAMHMYVRSIVHATELFEINNTTSATVAATRIQIRTYTPNSAFRNFYIVVFGVGLGTEVAVPLDRWFTLGLTFSVATKLMSLFIDGVEVKSSVMGTVTDVVFDTFKLVTTQQIQPLNSTDDFDVKSFEMHKRTLTPEQVMAQHQAMAA